MNNLSQTNRERSVRNHNSNNHNQIAALYEEFISVTNTNVDIAKKMLQENQWNLQKALGAYFDTPNNGQASASNDELFEENRKFKLLSWNIDGLDMYALEVRAQGVIDVIKKERPDAVFLQEVIPCSLSQIQTHLPEYDVHLGNVQNYFVVILTRKATLTVQRLDLIPYPGSQMDRNLLIIHARYRNTVNIDLMTSHHESGTEENSSHERMEQLKLCFKKMFDAPSDHFVLFGGDLNMRQKELYKIGNVPAGIYDLWFANGKPTDCEYTWDMQLNTNKNFSMSASRPRARFDRLYFRPSSDGSIKFQPVGFELKGLDIIPSVQRFCSDHWAIQVSFSV
ncbi:unnamed protein product [Adineta ricciae]|uniref:Endonuclease/exonuclease/phosphatase domain-containing protein n=1 Tax=Adineta ricciae TaxID=249248 RepID=A0A815H489_ADIRI|nr:unnamed protein product [Adineta ricciae]